MEFTIGATTAIPDGGDSGPPTVDAPTESFDSEAPYGRTKTGRIRKRPVGSGTRTSSAGDSPSGERNRKLAEQAAGVLGSIHDTMAMGAFSIGLRATPSAISTANEQFVSMATEALLNDPALCKSILRAGAKGGKGALIVIYGMFLIAVVPTAVLEVKTMRAVAAKENGE